MKPGGPGWAAPFGDRLPSAALPRVGDNGAPEVWLTTGRKQISAWVERSAEAILSLPCGFGADTLHRGVAQSKIASRGRHEFWRPDRLRLLSLAIGEAQL